MPERFWQGADHLKPVPFPKADRTIIRRDNQVVLHRPKALRYGLTLRMFTHFGCNPFTARIFCYDITAVTNVGPEAGWFGFMK